MKPHETKMENDQLDFFSMQEVTEKETAAPAQSAVDMFGCCGIYRECSDAGKCINPDQDHARGCRYRSLLESGKILYGKKSDYFNAQLYKEVEEYAAHLSPDDLKKLFSTLCYFVELGYLYGVFYYDPIFADWNDRGWIRCNTSPLSLYTNVVVNYRWLGYMKPMALKHSEEIKEWYRANGENKIKISKENALQWIRNQRLDLIPELCPDLCILEIQQDKRSTLNEFYLDHRDEIGSFNVLPDPFDDQKRFVNVTKLSE